MQEMPQMKKSPPKPTTPILLNDIELDLPQNDFKSDFHTAPHDKLAKAEKLAKEYQDQSDENEKSDFGDQVTVSKTADGLKKRQRKEKLQQIEMVKPEPKKEEKAEKTYSWQFKEPILPKFPVSVSFCWVHLFSALMLTFFIILCSSTDSDETKYLYRQA